MNFCEAKQVAIDLIGEQVNMLDSNVEYHFAINSNKGDLWVLETVNADSSEALVKYHTSLSWLSGLACSLGIDTSRDDIDNVNSCLIAEIKERNGRICVNG